ncbi:hypothetical protein [Alicyclobacillus sp. SO9]|uniref:hypothetical protein n=1 Tax=Alicyclobacillus sp. SO9 TaxID=2665646 RepID=UPI0018E8F9F4|nr:hypothetical protein [Alicyclobacillus sp. SO9]QQE80155.1 hypothetical protein GI364_06905 [Alicyclobacillus sp. SO9]
MDNPLSPNFFIGTIHIGQIESASCFNLGNNWPTNFRSYKKQNQGFGTVRGNHNSVTGSKSLLNDPDVIDAPNFSGKRPPEWLQRMLEQGKGPFVDAEPEEEENSSEETTASSETDSQSDEVSETGDEDSTSAHMDSDNTGQNTSSGNAID